MRMVFFGEIFGAAEMIRVTVCHHDVLDTGRIETELSQPILDMGFGFIWVVQRIKEHDTVWRIYRPRSRGAHAEVIHVVEHLGRRGFRTPRTTLLPRRAVTHPVELLLPLHHVLA